MFFFSFLLVPKDLDDQDHVQGHPEGVQVEREKSTSPENIESSFLFSVCFLVEFIF